MSGIMEAKVRVPKNKLGDLMEDLITKIPYAQVTGVTIIVPGSEDRRRKPVLITEQSKPDAEPPKDQSQLLSKPQRRLVQAMRNGASTIGDLTKAMGTPPWCVARMLNNLKRKKLIKVTDDGWTVLDKA
jgi:hypothetical protein